MKSLQRSPNAAPSPSSSDRPSLQYRERGSPVKNRTPHLFANAFFVHLPRFFPISLDCNVMSLVDAHSRVWAVRPRPCKGWLSPPPSAAVGLDRACRPAFAAANHVIGIDLDLVLLRAHHRVRCAEHGTSTAPPIRRRSMCIK